jgi:hypothetical protein
MVFRGRLVSNGRGAVTGGVGVRDSREGLSSVSDGTAESGEPQSHANKSAPHLSLFQALGAQ